LVLENNSKIPPFYDNFYCWSVGIYYICFPLSPQPQMVTGYIRQEYKIHKILAMMSDEFHTEKVSEICDLE
jgi:hypothetical protein